MRKPWLVLLSLVVTGSLWGCGDRGHGTGNSPVNPPVHTGELQAGDLHNEVMLAFQERAPLESISGMAWDEWLETTLNSMEEVSAAHDIPFDREETARHIVQLVTVFGAIRKATGIDPSMLRDSAAPENGMSRVISQLATWKVVDAKTAEMLSAFRVDADAAARAESITDTSLRDVFRIGASSREFWIAHEARTPISLSGSDGDPPCKKCDQGATISDYLGGVVGRLICGGDRTCAVMMAAASSLFFNQALGYCNDHPCGWPWWWPPLNP